MRGPIYWRFGRILSHALARQEATFGAPAVGLFQASLTEGLMGRGFICTVHTLHNEGVDAGCKILKESSLGSLFRTQQDIPLCPLRFNTTRCEKLLLEEGKKPAIGLASPKYKSDKSRMIIERVGKNRSESSV
jgi:hypothetical protein